jgi:hypothetical protein
MLDTLASKAGDRGKGCAYRVIKGKGAMQPAAVHVWASQSDPLPAFASEPRQGQRQGACLVQWATLDFLPVSVALGSPFAAVGPLFREIQGQSDLGIAQRQAKGITATMRKRGAVPSNATEGDAIGDGALALCAWRVTYGPRVLGESVALVCWRAIIASIARADMLGESIEHWRADDSGADCWDRLSTSALPLPPLIGDGSRYERACRLRFERARATRLSRLSLRMGLRKLRATGRQGESVDKVHRALVQLLYGASLDEAARAAGYKSRGQGRHVVRAGDTLTAAARRLGYRVQFEARQLQQKESVRCAESLPACREFPTIDDAISAPVQPLAKPLPAFIPAAWSQVPSASLPLQNGRGGKQRVALIRRLQRNRARAAKLASARAQWAAVKGRIDDKRATRIRAQARAAKEQGLVRCVPWWYDWRAMMARHGEYEARMSTAQERV